MSGKIRSDALLKNLPPERQEQIIEWCNTVKTEACPGGYQHAQEQLAADGVKVSLRALSDFWSWWNLRQDMQAAAGVEEAMLEANPTAVREAREAGELMFLKLSMVRQDPKAFAVATRAADRRGALELLREKFVTESCEKILKAAKDPKMREIAESEIPNAEKIALIRKAYFADIDALEVVLPE